MPRDCPAAIAVECGGALGEFNVLEGLVHCFCRGCQQGVEIGLQATNVFGLQAFEFHGGKGSAGKWKASIKAFPEGFPPEMVVGEDDAPIVGGKTRRDTGEALGPWLERVSGTPRTRAQSQQGYLNVRERRSEGAKE